MPDPIEVIRKLRLVPVIVIDDADDAVPLANALADGGLPIAEVTFRTAAAAEAIRRMTEARPDMLIGAGTVLTPEQADLAVKSGAKFIVSPGLNPTMVRHCLDLGIAVTPGVFTPSDIERGLELGLKVLKFFPAEPAGGVPFLKAISAPYGGVHFIPTGGINAEKLPAYLATKSVLACGGSWMAPAEWIKGKQFDRIEEETARAMATIAEITGTGK